MRLALASLLVPLFGLAQEFEVASVKLAAPWEPGKSRMGYRGGPGTGDPTRLVIDNYPMMLLVMRAYDVNPFQISGEVRGAERFNISAKIPEGTTPAQFRTMLQNLLAGRFKMKLHRETRDLPIYELVVAKGGPKFKEHEGEPPVEDLNGGPPARDKSGRPPPNSWSMEIPPGGMARGQHNAVAESMEEFAKQLSRQFARSVVDATGLKGRYDFLLSWSQDVPGINPGPPPNAASTPDPDSGPSLIFAIQQQLGLRLESKKGPVEILVIESFEKLPTEN